MSDFELPKAAAEQATPATEENKEKVVKKPEFDKNELLQIFDEIIFAGSYTESVSIKGKLKVAFRTRTAEEINSITMQLDGTSANLIATISEKRTLLNLHYGLVSYQGKDLGILKIEERVAFINKLAAPVIGALMVALGKFDSKVYAACQEGEENF